MSHERVILFRGSSNDPVEGRLLRELEASDLLMVERSWGPERDRIHQECLLKGVERDRMPQSLHWRWDRKAGALRLLEVKVVGILAEEGWQGAMLTTTASHESLSPADRGKPLVYVDCLEAAPWNWRVQGIGQTPRFRGVGVNLLREAIVQSIGEGFHGRLGLHSLPQSEGFYAGNGLTALGRDPGKQNLLYFEMTRDAAAQWLEREVIAR